jgi:hypothetical protein
MTEKAGSIPARPTNKKAPRFRGAFSFSVAMVPRCLPLLEYPVELGSSATRADVIPRVYSIYACAHSPKARVCC